MKGSSGGILWGKAGQSGLEDLLGFLLTTTDCCPLLQKWGGREDPRSVGAQQLALLFQCLENEEARLG